MERAKSFERSAQEAVDGQGRASRPVSRSGSFRNRSQSGNRNGVAGAGNQNAGAMEQSWKEVMERPGSRTDVDSRNQFLNAEFATVCGCS